MYIHPNPWYDAFAAATFAPAAALAGTTAAAGFVAAAAVAAAAALAAAAVAVAVTISIFNMQLLVVDSSMQQQRLFSLSLKTFFLYI